MILSIPVAWLQLVHQRIRFLATLAGIAFVGVLIFLQIGFQDALYASATQVQNNLKGDLFLISSQYNSLTSQQSFRRSRLYQTLGFDAVESVSPVYVNFAKLKNPTKGKKNPIYVIAFDPAKPIFNLPEIERKIERVQFPNEVLFDRNSRPEFGPIATKFQQGEKVNIEISGYNEDIGYRVKVGGLFSLGPSFGVDGNIIMSSSTFLRTFPGRQPTEVDIGLINLQSPSDPERVQIQLKAFLAKDVKVLTRQQFVNLEKNYWALRTPIGFIFNLMVAMAFVVGIAFVYQMLYSNISTHLVEYATLKAIGFQNKYLLNVVFQQAWLLAVLGYIPGFIISFFLYDVGKNATFLPIIMTLDKLLLVFTAVILMTFISGLLAIQRLRSADPADIF